jgi:hypothetical protein
VHDSISLRLTQLSQGWPRLHFSLRCRHGAHDSGMRFLFLTTRNCWLIGLVPGELLALGGDKVEAGVSVGAISAMDVRIWRRAGWVVSSEITQGKRRVAPGISRTVP